MIIFTITKSYIIVHNKQLEYIMQIELYIIVNISISIVDKRVFRVKEKKESWNEKSDYILNIALF